MENNVSSRMPKPWLMIVVVGVVIVIGIVRFVRHGSWSIRGKEERHANIIQRGGTAGAVTTNISVAMPQTQGTITSNLIQKGEVLPKEPKVSVVTSSMTQTSGNREQRQEMETASRMEENGDLVGARVVYWKMLGEVKDSQTLSEIETRLGRINMEIALTPREAPEKLVYVVKPGDSLEKIAKKFSTTVDLMIDGNDLQRPDLIKAGDRLLVCTGKFSIAISKRSNDLVLMMNGKFFKRYPVATGKHGKTPSGVFEISERQKEPVWWRPDGKEIPYGDPENILGTRWMSLKAVGDTSPVKGYGIHGTWDESMIGKSESAGCIRMRNTDVEKLFKFASLGTVVTIRD